jgi:hypothetical protein
MCEKRDEANRNSYSDVTNKLKPLFDIEPVSNLIPSKKYALLPTTSKSQSSKMSTVSAEGKMLLNAIYDIVNGKNYPKIKTERLLLHLNANPDKPWAAYHEGQPLVAPQLNDILVKQFGLHDSDMRFKAGKFKGFLVNSIVSAWCELKKRN